MDFDFITEDMALGSYPQTAGDVQSLKDAKITHVLNVREIDDPVIVKDSFAYCWNPTADWTPAAALGDAPKPVEWFQTSLLFWPDRHSEIAFPRLFVHCTAGVNRSATTAWLFLRAMRIKATDCSYIVDSNRLVAIWGLVMDRTWRGDAGKALRQLGFIE